MKKVVVLNYDEKWQREFIRLCIHLTSFLDHDCLAIRHVGSTSVVGLDAKPILDVDIVMFQADDLAHVTTILEDHGYKYRGDLGIAGRHAFGYFSSSFMRHHLYAVDPQAESYLDHLALREGLRSDANARAEYGRVKKELAKRFAKDIDAYIEGKTEIIRTIMESDAGQNARRFNKQPHTKEFLGEELIRLKTEGDFPGEITFRKYPFEIINLSGSTLIHDHLIGLANEIALGYKKTVE
jgi:GrpB-like predicted nucleotidyltransferase (UPF0157 family)